MFLVPKHTGRVGPVRYCSTTIFYFIFSIPVIIFALLFSLPSIGRRDSDPGSHGRLSSPLPTMVRALHFYREKISALPALVDSRRIVPTHARRSKQLAVFFVKIYSKSHHGGIRSPGPTLTTVVACEEGNH